VQALDRHHDRALVRSDRRRRTVERKKYSNALSKAAKQAKGDIKATLKSLASYYKSIANNDTQAIQNKAQDLAQASTKYAKYIVTNCVAENLPSGVTIPKIPGQ
jgi:hypothetical protein